MKSLPIQLFIDKISDQTSVMCVPHHQVCWTINKMCANNRAGFCMQVLDILAQNTINPVVLSGDIHNAFVWRLFRDNASTAAPVSRTHICNPVFEPMSLHFKIQLQLALPNLERCSATNVPFSTYHAQLLVRCTVVALLFHRSGCCQQPGSVHPSEDTKLCPHICPYTAHLLLCRLPLSSPLPL